MISLRFDFCIINSLPTLNLLSLYIYQAFSNKISKMSVKNQRRSRLNSSTRDTHPHPLANSLHPTDNAPTHIIEYLTCINNRVQFHRKLIQSLSLHLVCYCIKSTHLNCQRKDNQINENVNINDINDNGFMFQIVGGNLNVSKGLVKHTFAIMGGVADGIEYLRIEAPDDDIIVVQTCNFNNKVGVKLHIVSDLNKVNNKPLQTHIIRPIDLIEENARLRALKLNKSAAKSIKFSCESSKKLNINWNRQGQRPAQSPTNAEWRPKREGLKGAIFNIGQKCEIKGVEYKKSVEKYQRNKSRSFSKPENSSLKNLLHPKNLQKQNLKGKMTNSKSYKTLNASYAQGMIADKALKSKQTNKQEEQQQQQISSESYYTAKKDVYREIEIPQRIETKKLMKTHQKQNTHLQMSRSNNKLHTKYGYSQNRNMRQGQYNTDANSNWSSNVQNNQMMSSALDAKRFSKNISQAKIAQISRTLIGQKAKK